MPSNKECFIVTSAEKHAKVHSVKAKDSQTRLFYNCFSQNASLEIQFSKKGNFENLESLHINSEQVQQAVVRKTIANADSSTFVAAVQELGQAPLAYSAMDINSFVDSTKNMYLDNTIDIIQFKVSKSLIRKDDFK